MTHESKRQASVEVGVPEVTSLCPLLSPCSELGQMVEWHGIPSW